MLQAYLKSTRHIGQSAVCYWSHVTKFGPIGCEDVKQQHSHESMKRDCWRNQTSVPLRFSARERIKLHKKSDDSSNGRLSKHGKNEIFRHLLKFNITPNLIFLSPWHASKNLFLFVLPGMEPLFKMMKYCSHVACYNWELDPDKYDHFPVTCTVTSSTELRFNISLFFGTKSQFLFVQKEHVFKKGEGGE